MTTRNDPGGNVTTKTFTASALRALSGGCAIAIGVAFVWFAWDALGVPGVGEFPSDGVFRVVALAAAVHAADLVAGWLRPNPDDPAPPPLACQDSQARIARLEPWATGQSLGVVVAALAAGLTGETWFYVAAAFFAIAAVTTCTYKRIIRWRAEEHPA